MKKAEIEEKCVKLIEPIISDGGYDLWDIEYVKDGPDMYLRVYVDKEGGINIDDCVNISRSFEKLLDEEDFIKDAYILEVSSPGLTRQLKRKNDFIKSIGRAVDIKLYKKPDDYPELGSNVLEGAILEEYMEDSITVSYEENNYSFKLKDISRINLSFIDA